MSPTTAQMVTLSALLHDIGKFAQRAGEERHDRQSVFTVEDYGPHGAHARNSVQFIEQHVPAAFRSCGDAVLRHHKPLGWQSALVAAGDRWSASERQADARSDEAIYKPLRNVLATLRGDHDAQGPAGCFSLSAFDTGSEATFFPMAKEPDSGAQKREYTRLWKEFTAEHEEAATDDFDTYLVSLYSLLQKYTWCIPSAAWGSVPDVSLFDHCRLSAAIAAALCGYLSEGRRLDDFADPKAVEDEDCFLLVAGDLSGIQSYLYDLHTDDKVARRLRARSLYLQMVSEVAAQQVLRKAGMPFLNAIMVSGGNFRLLLPNTIPTAQAVAEAQRRMDAWLLKEFGGELTMNLASVPFSGSNMAIGQQGTGFGEVLRRGGEALSQRKQHRLREALQGADGWNEEAFVLRGFGGKNQCTACGNYPQGDGSDVCPHCADDIKVGRVLPKAAYLALYRDDPTGAYQNEQVPILPILGDCVAVVPRGYNVARQPYLVYALEDYDTRMMRLVPLQARTICNYVPSGEQEDGWPRALTFGDMAKKAEGRPLLGFLKADVDRLGEAFVFGLKGNPEKKEPDRDSASRLSQMSRALETFFSGWLPHLMETQFKDCYSVYAGGDDLLLVGPWDQVIGLATAIRDDFARLVQNPGLHLSAGIFLAKPGYPIRRAAGAADRALDEAKDACRNRVSILSHVLTWDEWDTMRGLWRGPELEPEARKVSTAFLYHLLTYARMWREYRGYLDTKDDPDEKKRRGNPLGLRFQPLLAYDISRNLSQKDFPGLYAFAQGLVSALPQKGAKEWVIMDNLGLLAQLWILGRRGAERRE